MDKREIWFDIKKRCGNMKDYIKKDGYKTNKRLDLQREIMGIGQTGDLIWYKKRCSNMKDFVKKMMDIRQTGD